MTKKGDNITQAAHKPVQKYKPLLTSLRGLEEGKSDWLRTLLGEDHGVVYTQAVLESWPGEWDARGDVHWFLCSNNKIKTNKNSNRLRVICRLQGQ